jgi:hypothetical protein
VMCGGDSRTKRVLVLEYVQSRISNFHFKML